MKAVPLAVAVAALCGACAIIPEEVAVNYTPDPAVTRTAVMGAGEVGLVVTDLRHAESAKWIADKKNGYGMRMASVNAQRPVTELVRDALAQELTQRGFRVADTGRTAISIEVTRLESVYQIRFFTVGAIGTADLSVQVRRADGSIAFARNFSVSNDNEGDLAGTAGQARRSVEAALSKVAGQIVSDPAFIAALGAVPRIS